MQLECDLSIQRKEYIPLELIPNFSLWLETSLENATLAILHVLDVIDKHLQMFETGRTRKVYQQPGCNSSFS